MDNLYRRTSFSVAVFCVFVSLSLCNLKPAPASITLPLRSKKGMVVSAQPLASEAGLTLLMPQSPQPLRFLSWNPSQLELGVGDFC